MAQPWIVEECRRQAVIYVATASAAAQWQQRAACPAPLFERDGSLAGLIQEHWKAAMASRPSSSEVVTTVAGVLREARVEAFPREAWTFGELVGWWLQAGEAIAAFTPQWRVALVRVLAVGDGGEPAALWCAERMAHYAIRWSDFQPQQADGVWRKRADGPTPYLKRLFEWVTSKDRPRPGRPAYTSLPWAWVDAMREESATLAEDARRLFGPGWDWHAGDPLTIATVDQWRAMPWVDKTRSGKIWEPIRTPVVHGGRGSPPLVRGWVACQSPGAVVRGLVSKLEAGDGVTDSFAAAARFAAIHWGSSVLPSKAWCRGQGGTDAPPPIHSEAGFLAVARVLAAADVHRPPCVDAGQPRSGMEALQVALALDGLQVRAEEGSAPAAGRVIPCNGTLDAGPPRRLTLIRRSTGFQAEIGWTAAAPCPTTRLSLAVEDFDWRAWQMTVMARSRPKLALHNMAEITVAAGKLSRWEQIKRELLSAGMDASPEPLLSLAFDFAQRRRLTLELLASKTAGKQGTEVFDPLLAGLIDACREVTAAVLERLHVIDPAALSRLAPPRLVDGAVDGLAWLSRPVELNGDEIRYSPIWRRDHRPFGHAVEEFRDAQDGICVVLSAVDASAADVRLLNAALGKARVTAPEHPNAEQGLWLELVHTFATRMLERAVANPLAADFGPEVAWLRERCAGGDTDAFHALITDRLADREVACEWCTILAEDPRFHFEVHPSVDFAAGTLAAPQPADRYLRWEFHDTIPAGRDIGVRYALVAEQACRTISRGPRVAGSPADRADELVAVAARAGSVWSDIAVALRDATDRWQAFASGDVPHPATAVVPLLQALVQTEATPPVDRAAVFAALRDWASTVGHEILPACWSPDQPPEATALPEVAAPPVFNEHVPAGCLVMQSLGLGGEHAVAAKAMISAGPAPGGFRELRSLLEALEAKSQAGHTPSWEEAAARVRDLPRHALARTLPLAGPNLFDCIWETAAMASDEGDEQVEQAKQQMAAFLKAACGMVTFLPTNLRDFGSGWVQEIGGNPPRGRRIRSLVRPGLRTIGNQLVRPAIVITE